MSREHDLIKRCFAPLCSGEDQAPAFGLMDDAAFLPPAGEMAVSSDMLVAGVHFFPADPPASIARKALAVNVSDLIAKGARPDHYLLAIAIPPGLDEGWLEAFAAGLGKSQQIWQCSLIGGDSVSTPGPLTISITIMGRPAASRLIRRKGAGEGDLLYVSGTIGDAALGLLLRKGDERLTSLKAGEREYLRGKYLHPTPRLELAAPLGRLASAAMDISDGLAGDLEKLCAASGVGAIVESARLPLSSAARCALANHPALLETVLAGGDDYQILAAVPADAAREFEKQAGGLVTCIGRITGPEEGPEKGAEKGVIILGPDGQPLDIGGRAYDHFGQGA